MKIAYVTLHVGIGTFRPVKCENIEEHHMHFEEYSVTEENAKMINDAIDAGGLPDSGRPQQHRNFHLSGIRI